MREQVRLGALYRFKACAGRANATMPSVKTAVFFTVLLLSLAVSVRQFYEAAETNSGSQFSPSIVHNYPGNYVLPNKIS